MPLAPAMGAWDEASGGSILKEKKLSEVHPFARPLIGIDPVRRDVGASPLTAIGSPACTADIRDNDSS